MEGAIGVFKIRALGKVHLTASIEFLGLRSGMWCFRYLRATQSRLLLICSKALGDQYLVVKPPFWPQTKFGSALECKCYSIGIPVLVSDFGKADL
jgi:hypothetical protein